MNKLQRFYPHALAFIGFVLVSLIYFYPVLQGKKLLQSDIVQYTAMAKEQNDFRATQHTEPYWTNSAFGGMPTYQLGANYPHDYIKKIDNLLRFLPRPADYMFLYFIGFYVLLLVLRIRPLLAFFGALAFGLSTYLIIILGAGHNAKAHAIAYMPLVVAGVLLVYQKRYLVGGLLTLFAAALEINANHFQMTYYLLLFLIIVTLYYVYQAIKQKQYQPLLYSFATFAVAAVLSIGVNATNIMATSEYAQQSTRGKSELTYTPDGKPSTQTSAMTYDYITEYSYGVLESFNLLVPRLMGGSNHENLGTDSQMYKFAITQSVPPDQAKEIVKGLPTYWGDQPIVAGPAYIGAVLFFLAILGLFCEPRKIKYIFLIGAIYSLLLSWGKNFPVLTDFFINYIPLYNKFRAVSSIQVILEMCLPVLAILGLQSFFYLEKEQKWKYLWQTTAICIASIATLFLAKGFFSFASTNDGYLLESYGTEFIEALKQDRKSLFMADLLRSSFLILLAATLLWLSIQKTISTKTATIVVALVMVFDLFFIAKNYLDANAFTSAQEVNEPFIEAPFDTAILKDKSHYRVFEVSANAMADPRASYFHKSIGGYHAAKPRRMQELFDYQITKNNLEVLNMLNVKYLIQTNPKGEKLPILNTKANGNAWFVSQLKTLPTPTAEMKALTNLDTKNTAITSSNNQNATQNYSKSANSTITLTHYQPNQLQYTSNNTANGYAVFSEMYYKNGWNAYIDNKLVPHQCVNYVLRGLAIPAGKHQITFKFEPQIIKTGSTIALISFIAILLVFVSAIIYQNKKAKH